MSDRLVDDVSQYGFQMMGNALGFLGDFLNVVGNKSELIAGQVTVDKLYTHVAKGGELKQILFDKEHLSQMEESLRKEGVLYSIIAIGDSDKLLCLYRDSDSFKVEMAKERFKELVGIGVRELKPDNFLEIYKDSSVGKINNIDAYRLELMRTHLQNEDVSFTVVKNGDNYSILYPKEDQRAIETAIKRTSWDLASNESDNIRKSIQVKLDNRDKVNNILQDVKDGKPLKHNLILVDSKNPNRFIELNNEGFIMHNLTTETKKVPDEALQTMIPKKVVTDIKSDVIGKDNKDFSKLFFKSLNQINEAVPLKEESFPLFKGESEYQIYDETYEATHKQFVEEIRQIEQVYPKGYTVTKPCESEIYSIKNLNDNEQFQFYQKLQNFSKDDYSFDNGQLAYKESIKEDIENIIKEVCFADKTPDEVELTKLRLKGYDVDKKEALIIMDKDNPMNKPVMINEHKEKILVLSQENSFNEALNGSLGETLANFKHPVVVTVDEYVNYSNMEPDARNTQINIHVSKVEENFEEKNLRDSEEDAKKNFEKGTSYDESGELQVDYSLKKDNKSFNNKHLQKALRIAATFTCEVIEGKGITREIENVHFNRIKAPKR